jgi:hypothetical protein
MPAGFQNLVELQILMTRKKMQKLRIRKGRSMYLSPFVPFRMSFDPEDLRIKGNPFPTTLRAQDRRAG